MGGKKPLRRPLWPPTRATASNYYPLGLDGAGGAAKPLLRAPKKPAPLHGRLPAFSGAVDAFERARKCFLEWRYFFSIILSEFLKNRVALHSHKIRPVLIEENASLAVDLGFYEPLGYVIDRNNTKFETFKVTIHYLFNGNEKQQSQSLSGEWKIGEKAIFTFPLEKELSGDIDVRIEVLATLSSYRPYQYRDNICMDFTETVKINRSSGVSQKESVISSINASNY